MSNEIELARVASDLGAIREYAKSTSPSVRLAVARNPVTPQDVIVQLAKSNDMDVRLAALDRLDPAALEELGVRRGETYASAPKIFMSTIGIVPELVVLKVVGLVYGSSSKAAWGFDSQAERLDDAMKAALLDLEQNTLKMHANAVLGMTFAANSSPGSSTMFGNSEGIMVMGTAVLLE